MTTDAVRISVVIVNWNRCTELRALLLDLRAQTEPADEVIVVDNGSTDDSRAMLAAEFSEIRLVALDRNTGLSQGRNEGIAVAKHEWISILDNDLRILDRDFWRKARRSIARHGDCGTITFHLVQGVWTANAAGEAKVFRLPDLESLGREGGSPCEPRAYYEWFVWGGCCLISRQTFDTVGLFDPFFAYGGEEWDFAYRCHASGIRLLRDTSLWAVHGRSPKMRSDAAPLLILQNMIIAQARYMPTRDLALFLVLQLSKSAIEALRGRRFASFGRMCGRLVMNWPREISAKRRPVGREVMRRFYYLRIDRPRHYSDVERARTGAWEFYRRRAAATTVEQREAVAFALMQE